MGADVEIGHGFRATARGINRKAAGKTERIQHAPATRQRFHLAAILALVEKETRFLPAQNVRFKAQAVLQENNWSAEHRLGPLRKEDFPIAPNRSSVFRSRLDVPAQTENDSFARHIFF